MRMGLYVSLVFVAGLITVCLFDVLAQMSQEYKRLADEESKALQIDLQFKAKR